MNPVLASVIIPVHNQLGYTKICLQSLKEHTKVPHEIIVVDNGSTDGTLEWLKSLSSVTLVRSETNLGFACAANLGILLAEGEVIILLNNDTVPSHRWLPQLTKALLHDERVGLAGPVSNRVIDEQLIPVTFGSFEEIHRFSEQFNRHDPKKWRDVERLSGFCLAFRKSLVDEIGGFDENFGLGYYEDLDFCMRASLAGYRLLAAGDTYVHHFGSRTSMKKGLRFYLQLNRKNEAYFKQKWSDRL